MNLAPHFALESEISSLTRLDAPLTMATSSRASKPRMGATIRKTSAELNSDGTTSSTSGGTSVALNASFGRSLNGSVAAGRLNASSSSMSTSLMALSKSTALNNSLQQQGSKRMADALKRTPSKGTRGISPSRGSKTPSGIENSMLSRSIRCKTPNSTGKRTTTPPRGGDRFIPSRTATDFETASFRITRGDLLDNGNESALSPSKREYQRRVAEMLTGTADPDSMKFIAYGNKAPEAPESHANGLKFVYSQSKTPGSTAKKMTRHIPQAPERILDAPEMVNDYYLNLIDWSSNNHLAVALGANVYLWNAASGDINQLLELEEQEDYVCSVKWIPEGNCLAVGNSTGEVSLWDIEQSKKIRSLTGHSDRIGCLSWNQYILSSGSRSGNIHHSDVRIADHMVGQLAGHSQEVCGLAWSPNGRLLASGGNDNVLNVWEVTGGGLVTDSTPKYTFTHHQAAVKAVAWCPWQPNILASGGGTADRCIRTWNCNTGTLLNATDTKSQVCALLWSSEYKELVSSHGFANNEVTIWKYPAMVKVAELMGHTERVLHMALSPDGSTVVSAGADETLRLWKCFAPDPNKKKDALNSKAKSSGAQMFSRALIR